MSHAIHALKSRTKEQKWIPGSRQGFVPAFAGRRGLSAHHGVLPGEIGDDIREIKLGYAIDRFESLKKGFGVNGETLSRIASISLATMHRRKISGRFTANESEKLYRLQKLYETALEVLETEENVKAWFNTRQIVFENKTPIEYADTLPGSDEVENVLRRMEHGVIL